MEDTAVLLLGVKSEVDFRAEADYLLLRRAQELRASLVPVQNDN